MSDIVKFSVLIVDDEKSSIRVLHHILQPEYTVFTAKNGQTAIEMTKEYMPDLILLDIIMPDMTGYEVLVELKNSDITRKIPVIFITGLSSVEEEEKGFLMGAVDYIIKPFNNTIVKVRVRQHLQIVKQIRTIERLVMIDPLTDIPNRRSFNNQLDIEWKRAIREKKPISILMIDVDKFKLYNDRYGHMQGDVLLQTLAEIFKRTLKRSADFVARWGGEEFVVLLPNTDLNGALEIARQMLANVKDAVIPCPEGSDTKITVSIGVNSQTPGTDSTVDSFISKADKALYAAKEAGRDRICT